MTIVKFTQHPGYTYYYPDQDGDLSGEYVTLTDNRALFARMEKLYDLIDRINDLAPVLRVDYFEDGATYKSIQLELDILLKDCKEAVGKYG